VAINNAKLQELNTRLKRGEGWIGYRTSKGSNGEKLPSKFLYFAFYQRSQQKFVNSKTNDPEEAYRQLLDARRATTEGVRLLPSEVSRIRYEDLSTILLDYYREHKPRSIIKRYTGDIDSAGNKLTEEVFAGADKLDKFFKRMPITEITALKIKDYVKWHRKEGDADPTIRRQLGNLRSAFTQAKALDLITDSHIPTFVLPADSKPRKGFLDLPEFSTLRDAVPEKFRPALTFLYFSGCRSGAAKKITWTMIDKDCSENYTSSRDHKERRTADDAARGSPGRNCDHTSRVTQIFPVNQLIVFSILGTSEIFGMRPAANSLLESTILKRERIQV